MNIESIHKFGLDLHCPRDSNSTPFFFLKKQVDIWISGQFDLHSEFQDRQDCCYTEKACLIPPPNNKTK